MQSSDPPRPLTPAFDGPLPMRSGRILSGQPRTKQFFDWGNVNWLVEPAGPAAESVSVGEITFYPNRGEPEHSHYGEAQVLHVISGQGIQTVNGQAASLKIGDTFYLPPYCSHSLTNTSSEDLVLLGVYIHRRSRSHIFNLDNVPEEGIADLDLASIIDLKITGRLINNLSQALKLSLSLFDASGKCLIKSDRQSVLCRKMGEAGQHCQEHISKAFHRVAYSAPSFFTSCCGQVSSIIIPVVSGQIVCGYIKCGEFFITPNDLAAMAEYVVNNCGALAGSDSDELLADISVEKKSRLHSAAEATAAVANYIVESGLAMLRRRERDKNRLSIIKEQMNTATLEKALREADFKLLQSQINPHFLFNTLNTISQKAYMEGADTAAGLVCNLADLMRATLRKANQLVPLREEISLLRDYLNIQKARFAERLELKLEMEPGLDDILLPILILQPLVENAIVHGLEPKLDSCRVEIVIKQNPDGRLYLSVRDNGPGFSPGEESNSKGLGLRSIRARLKHFYNDNFSLNIDSRPGRGTLMEITVPSNNKVE